MDKCTKCCEMSIYIREQHKGIRGTDIIARPVDGNGKRGYLRINGSYSVVCYHLHYWSYPYKEMYSYSMRLCSYSKDVVSFIVDLHNV